MAGIYIHFPFCVKRCYYCDFYSTTSLKYIDSYLKALLKEVHLRKDYLSNQAIETIYFGGGTPSVLKVQDIERVLKELKNNYSISKSVEITIEINPDDNYTGYFKNLYSIGINRLSIGAQSFDDKFLELMNRRHKVEQVYKCIENATEAGIKNIGIDLLYGLPGMNLDLWNSTLEKAFNLPIKHLSAYHITYEKGTVFYDLLKQGKLFITDEEDSWLQYKMLHELADKYNFDHYEISNFSKKGYHSQHNSNYWNGAYYLGLGPSAHSYNGSCRQWNFADLRKYINSIEANKPPFDSEQLTLKDKANDYILTKLRTKPGLDLDVFKNLFNDENYKLIMKGIKKYVTSEHADIRDNTIYLTLKGWFISDKIISDLMII